MTDIQDLTNGRWPDLLSHFCALTPEQLSDKHQPCPLCGGKDRYRFDDRDGSGSWFCNQCGGRDHMGGAGSGLDLLMRCNNWTFTEATARIRSYLNVPTPPPTAGAEAVWHYSDTFLVARFPGKNIRPSPGPATAGNSKHHQPLAHSSTSQISFLAQRIRSSL